jgi:prepilin-type N-terminal cleavage/methylation domain-containing protein
MIPIRFKLDQRGMTLIELMIVIMLGVVVMLGAGAIHRGVYKSFKMGSLKLVAQQEASLLAQQINRRVRYAANFEIYNVPIRTDPTTSGNGLALLDENGLVTYRFEWNSTDSTLADSTGARVTAMSMQNLQFRSDANFPKTLFYSYQADDEIGDLIDIESASSLRN